MAKQLSFNVQYLYPDHSCGLVFQSLIYFAKYPGLPRNLLGRIGWLRNLRLAVIDYDNMIYLNTYDD